MFLWGSCMVQLLITSLDVENYKLIKADLDRLRTLVEKSELWVEKKNSGGGEGKKDKKDKKEKEEVRSKRPADHHLHPSKISYDIKLDPNIYYGLVLFVVLTP